MIQDMFEAPLPFHLRLYKWNISRLYHSSILAALYVYAWIYSMRCFYFGKDWQHASLELETMYIPSKQVWS